MDGALGITGIVRQALADLPRDKLAVLLFSRSSCSPLPLVRVGFMFYGFIGDESLEREKIEPGLVFYVSATVCLEFFYDQSRRWSQAFERSFRSLEPATEGVKHNSLSV
jgi:hypothetical protein